MVNPDQLAHTLREELSDALVDLGVEKSRARPVAVHPPADTGPDSRFRFAFRLTDDATVEIDLPASLAVGYLADEEAAVDEWKLWVHRVAARLGR